ncbi:hypothetical protein B0H11DRAFT_2203846 [Mycena galericulata]|nr:hypothetical protein B0H11DRAFT_2203846 [Mycena galericulata]
MEGFYEAPTLVTLPTDILHVILHLLHDVPDVEFMRFNEERFFGTRLIPLSETSRYMRAQTLPWIFREVYNWSRNGETVWPNALWPFFATVHLRDRSVRHPAPIAFSDTQIFSAFPRMCALTKITVRLEAPIPPQLLGAISLVPLLSSLEIHQARFDGAAPPPNLAFPSLKSLLICICGFKGVIRAAGIDRIAELRNVAALLTNLTDGLTTLCISGDLISPEFPSLRWRNLRALTVTEHTPTPYVPVPELVFQMPALRELSVLFSADLTRDLGEVNPPFRLGTPGGALLTCSSPLLSTVTLSNLEPGDPIFAQLPPTLDSLHLLAKRDVYVPGLSAPHRRGEAPLTPITILTALPHISHLEDLTELSLTLNDFSTGDLIETIACNFPRLRFLQLGHSLYPGDNHDLGYKGVHDDAILHALKRLPRLTHLKIALHFPDRELDDAPERNAACWLMQGLPSLQSVAFPYELTLLGAWVFRGPESPQWNTWDRSILLEGPYPDTPPSPEQEPRASIVLEATN